MRGSAEGWSSHPQPVEGAGQNCAGTAVVEDTMHAIVAAMPLGAILHAPSLLRVEKPTKLSGPQQGMDEDASSSN